MTGNAGSSKRRPAATLAAGAALLAFAAGCWLAAFDPVLATPDGCDYAQMGRELGRGHGFATQQLFPRHLAFLAARGHDTSGSWPNLHRYPATPLSVAGALLVEDDPVRAAVIQSGVWSLLSVPLVLLIARRFAPLGVAALCGLLFIADPHAVRAAHSGMTESFAVFVVLLFFLVLSWRPERGGKWLLLGGICGLAYLTRTQLAVVLPIGLLAAWTSAGGPRRRKAVALLLLGAALALAPWMARNAAVAGDPTFSFSTSRNLMRDVADFDPELDLDAPAGIWDLVRGHGRAIAGKWSANLARFFDRQFWSKTFGGWITVFLLLFLAASVTRWGSRDGDYHLFKRNAALFFLATFVVVAAAFHRDRFYDPVRPVVLIVACIEVWRWLDGWRRLRRWRAATGVLLTLALAFGIYSGVDATRRQVGEGRAVAAGERLHREAHVRVSQLVPRSAVVVSDVSFRVALHADRRSIRLPREPAALEEIADRVPAFRYLLLGERAGEAFAGYSPGAYAAFVRSPEFRSRFRLVERLANGAVLYQRVR